MPDVLGLEHVPPCILDRKEAPALVGSCRLCARIPPRLACEPQRRKERTRQALNGLLASGVLTCRDGWLWLP